MSLKRYQPEIGAEQKNQKNGLASFGSYSTKNLTTFKLNDQAANVRSVSNKSNGQKQMTPKQSSTNAKAGEKLQFYENRLGNDLLIGSAKTKSSSQKVNDQNILSKEFLRLQIREKEQQSQKTSKNNNVALSSSELASAMQKYHQYLQQTQSKVKQNEEAAQSKNQQYNTLKNERQLLSGPHNQSQNILSSIVTKGVVDEKKGLLKKERIQLTPKNSEQNYASKQFRPTTSELLQLSSKQQQPNDNAMSKTQKRQPYPARQFSEAQIVTKQTPMASQQIQKPQSFTPQTRNNQKQYFESRKTPKSTLQGVQGYYLQNLRKSFIRPFSDDYFCRLYRDHFYQTYQGIYFSQFLKAADPKELKNKAVQLKRSEKYNNKITLVLDLDETLVHCNENTSIPSDIVLNIQITNTESINAGINIRPYAKQLLENLKDDFEIIVFTASHQCYASKVLDYLDPKNTLIAHRLFRENCCMTTGGMYTKDLRIFTDRNLDQLVLVDNAAYSYAWQIDNGIPIIPYYDNKEDNELVQLEQYLKEMLKSNSAKEFNKYIILLSIIRTHLKLSLFNDPAGPQKVFEKLFGYPMDS